MVGLTMTSDDMYDKHREAGKILQQVMSETTEMVDVGESILEVAEHAENRCRELGGEPAFPCNISINDEAAHATPKAGNSKVFGEDIVKIDFGVHVDGYIADMAKTVDLSGHPDLVQAAEEALEAAIGLIRAGVDTAEIGAAIQEAIESYGYKPVVNLTGHGLQQYVQHAPPSIPNKAIDKGVELDEGLVVAIEPFATDGSGKVGESSGAEIYSLIAQRPVRLPAARKLLEEIEGFHGLPFAKRWLTSRRASYALTHLERSGVVRGYDILREVGGGLVSQAEHTVIVQQDGCEVITR